MSLKYVWFIKDERVFAGEVLAHENRQYAIQLPAGPLGPFVVLSEYQAFETEEKATLSLVETFTEKAKRYSDSAANMLLKLKHEANHPTSSTPAPPPA